jgi:hypothetical protein
VSRISAPLGQDHGPFDDRHIVSALINDYKNVLEALHHFLPTSLLSWCAPAELEP